MCLLFVSFAHGEKSSINIDNLFTTLEMNVSKLAKISSQADANVFASSKRLLLKLRHYRGAILISNREQLYRNEYLSLLLSYSDLQRSAKNAHNLLEINRVRIIMEQLRRKIIELEQFRNSYHGPENNISTL